MGSAFFLNRTRIINELKIELQSAALHFEDNQNTHLYGL